MQKIKINSILVYERHTIGSGVPHYIMKVNVIFDVFKPLMDLGTTSASDPQSASKIGLTLLISVRILGALRKH